jgi:phage repressor protein C with HTH and peptisase S24 domain/transcriptional regulator with XRE-family HTH domain
MTIQERIKHIRQESGKTQADFAASIGLKRDNYAQIEVGKQLPSLEAIAAIVRIYNKSYSWLIDGKETDKKVTPAENEGKGNPKGNLKGNLTNPEQAESYTKKVTHDVYPTVDPIVYPTGKGGKDSYTKKVYSTEKGTLKVDIHEPAIVDTSGLSIVPIVDISAAAGDGYMNVTEHIDETKVLRLPQKMVKSGFHLCIQVKGHSMAPTLQDGGYLVIRLLERSDWLHIRNEYVYVIVDNEGKTYVKRLKNRFKDTEDGGFIVCMSDSLDKMAHPNFNLHPHEIQHIWFVEWYFTAKMPNLTNTAINRMSRLEDEMAELRELMTDINKRLK